MGSTHEKNHSHFLLPPSDFLLCTRRHHGSRRSVILENSFYLYDQMNRESNGTYKTSTAGTGKLRERQKDEGKIMKIKDLQNVLQASTNE
jgi:hypothetical protein